MRERAKARLLESGNVPISLEEVGSDVMPAAAINHTVIGNGGHINFFQNLENGEGVDSTNKEHEEEKKKEQEEYEKKVGYLTYLGQDTEELNGEQVWWKKKPKDRLASSEMSKEKSAINEKQKEFLDPLSDLRKYLKCDGVRLTMKKFEKKREKEVKAVKLEPTKKKRGRSSSSSRSSSRERSRNKKKRRRNDSPYKSKRRRASSSSNSSSADEQKALAKCNLEKMRRERIERERVEREKANKLVHGEPEPEQKDDKEDAKRKNQKYNSQFNPEFARQNKLDPSVKYWLQ